MAKTHSGRRERNALEATFDRLNKEMKETSTTFTSADVTRVFREERATRKES